MRYTLLFYIVKIPMKQQSKKRMIRKHNINSINNIDSCGRSKVSVWKLDEDELNEDSLMEMNYDNEVTLMNENIIVLQNFTPEYMIDADAYFSYNTEAGVRVDNDDKNEYSKKKRAKPLLCPMSVGGCGVCPMRGACTKALTAVRGKVVNIPVMALAGGVLLGNSIYKKWKN